MAAKKLEYLYYELSLPASQIDLDAINKQLKELFFEEGDNRFFGKVKIENGELVISGNVREILQSFELEEIQFKLKDISHGRPKDLPP